MSEYDRELVELLLPAVWDDGYAYGMPLPYAPDRDMPKGYSNPAHSGTLYAHLADIRAGWASAPLTTKERRALVLRYRDDLLETAIGKREGANKQAISVRLASAVGKIVATLNGKDYDTDDEED